MRGQAMVETGMYNNNFIKAIIHDHMANGPLDPDPI
jgi:hypothetical protein